MPISHETKRAKKIIVELVRQAGGQFQNKTNLFKAFWKAHLDYAANNAGYLSNWPMIRTQNGPAIGDFDLLMSEMLADGWLTIDEADVGSHRSMLFKLGPSCPPPALPKAAVEAIGEGVKSVGGTLGNGSNDESLRQSRVWRETKDGEEMEIYLDLIGDDERARLEADFAILKTALDEPYLTSRK
jgi:hypothetical protein